MSKILIYGGDLSAADPPNDDDLVVTLRFIHVGKDLPKPDFDVASVTIPDGTGVVQAKTMLKNALAARAQAAGHAFNGKVVYLGDLFSGLSA